MKYIKISLLVFTISIIALAFKDRKPVLYIIGDSTVKNGDGKPSNQLQGWGSVITPYFDTTKITIENDAIGGRSSRTFLTDGRWDKILATLQPGDFVIMQFGHNDSGALDDSARARGTIKGTGEDSSEIYNPILKRKEVVHTYGWYLRKYVNEAKAKGATAIVCSPIPRNDWKDGKVSRSNDGYTKWAKETAETTGAYYIDLNNNIGDAFEKLGQDSVTKFYPQEHTHTNAAGAKFNAGMVVNGMKAMNKLPLKNIYCNSMPSVEIRHALSLRKLFLYMKLFAASLSLLFYLHISAQKIDRKALVQRHNVVVTKVDTMSSLTVGNGSFAYTVDVTGMQSFPLVYQHGIPLGTQSEWGWHSFPNNENYQPNEALKTYHLNGKEVTYAVQVKEPERAKKAVDWLRQNPHRLQLGNWGMQLIKKDGSVATINDLTNINQQLDLWTGTVTSYFSLEGVPVEVKTVCHPTKDLISVKLKSDLLKTGRIRFTLKFPYPTGGWADEATFYGNKEKHNSFKSLTTSGYTFLLHQLDSTFYYAFINWRQNWAPVKNDSANSFTIKPLGGKNTFEINCSFFPAVISSKNDTVVVSPASKNRLPISVTDRSGKIPSFSTSASANANAWKQYWTTGGAIDFSGSTDPRANELERRMILSQYLMKTQEAGRFPPQETGLTYNSWYGRPHLEMVWWHAVHYALWGKIEYLEKLMPWYEAVAGEAFHIAKRQGYDGLRWQKMTDTLGHEGPSSVGAFLVWQQPHYIYFAELIYRAHPTQQTLQQYQKLLFATADFMASYARYDSARKNYVLGKGLIPAQERFKAEETFNPTFELVYWHWALSTAQQWRKRLGLPPDAKYQQVLDHLSPLPVQDSVYLPTESATDAYTNPDFRTDHPAVLGALGYLPFTSQMDTARMHHTFNWIWSNWSWKDTWGWDFPLTAMVATRLGQPEKAIKALLMPITTNTYLPNGHNYQDERLRIYMPGNGGLLTALAMMCAGYDGSKEVLPGIPKNSGWHVRWEGLEKMP